MLRPAFPTYNFSDDPAFTHSVQRGASNIVRLIQHEAHAATAELQRRLQSIENNFVRYRGEMVTKLRRCEDALRKTREQLQEALTQRTTMEGELQSALAERASMEAELKRTRKELMDTKKILDKLGVNVAPNGIVKAKQAWLNPQKVCGTVSV